MEEEEKEEGELVAGRGIKWMYGSQPICIMETNAFTRRWNSKKLPLHYSLYQNNDSVQSSNLLYALKNLFPSFLEHQRLTLKKLI